MSADPEGGIEILRKALGTDYHCYRQRMQLFKVRNNVVDLKTGLFVVSGKSVIWVVVRTYCEHAEYSLEIYKSSEEPKEFLQIHR